MTSSYQRASLCHACIGTAICNKEDDMEKVFETNDTGSFCLEKILTKELCDKCSLYARVTVPPGVAVPYHRHDGNGESYFFLAGEGEYDDN
jgi:mannose-6-phosphate isomerase-like protein (cupin superfamily)